VIPPVPPKNFSKRPPRDIPGKTPTPSTPLPKIFIPKKHFPGNVNFYLRTSINYLIFSTGLPTAACHPRGDTGRIRGVRGVYPGDSGAGAMPLQIYVPKYALWSSRPDDPRYPERHARLPPWQPRGTHRRPPCADRGVDGISQSRTRGRPLPHCNFSQHGVPYGHCCSRARGRDLVQPAATVSNVRYHREWEGE
jgi:hypothetical protein